MRCVSYTQLASWMFSVAFPVLRASLLCFPISVLYKCHGLLPWRAFHIPVYLRAFFPRPSLQWVLTFVFPTFSVWQVPQPITTTFASYTRLASCMFSMAFSGVRVCFTFAVLLAYQLASFVPVILGPTSSEWSLLCFHFHCLTSALHCFTFSFHSFYPGLLPWRAFHIPS